MSRWQAEQRRRLTVALITRGDAEANRARAQEHGLEPMLLQAGDEIARAYGSHGTPSAILIAGDGRIAAEIGYGAGEILDLLEHAVEPVRPETATDEEADPSTSDLWRATTRREVLARGAAGALALAGVATFGFPSRAGAASLKTCHRICFDAWSPHMESAMNSCRRFYNQLLENGQTGAYARRVRSRCFQSQDLIFGRRIDDCLDACRKNGGKPPKDKLPPFKKPPKAAPVPALCGGACLDYCSPCYPTESGHICCSSPPKDGKSPCCPGEGVDVCAKCLEGGGRCCKAKDGTFCCGPKFLPCSAAGCVD